MCCDDPAGGGKSVCNGPCATNWPPLMATAEDKASGDYTVITRDDGKKQSACRAGRCTFCQGSEARRQGRRRLPQQRLACHQDFRLLNGAGLDALETRIAELIPRLRRYARALTGERAAADDLVQDTLERAWRKLALWRPGQRPAGLAVHHHA